MALGDDQNEGTTPERGREGRAGRHRGVVPALTFFGLLGAGVGAVYTVGAVARGSGGALVNISMITLGAVFAAGGVWLLGGPKGLTMAGSLGNDAWGRMQYGPGQLATSQQLRVNGAICLAFGIAAVLLGVFFGLLG